MTPREGFKYGFLLRCAEEGLTAREAEARAARGLEKRAAGFWGSLAGSLGSGIANTATNVITGTPAFGAKWLGAGLGAAALGAGAGGYALGKLREGEIDPEEVQREELIAAYRTQAELARRKAIMDAVQQTQPRPRSHHGI